MKPPPRRRHRHRRRETYRTKRIAQVEIVSSVGSYGAFLPSSVTAEVWQCFSEFLEFFSDRFSVVIGCDAKFCLIAGAREPFI